MIDIVTRKLVNGQLILPGEMEACATEMMEGTATSVLMAAFLTALHMRGETIEDLAAFATVMRDKAAPFVRASGVVLDTCGTGGDASGTFNISTAAAFVAAGAGVRVAKHGNRSMSSKCGSADVLTELGVEIECDPSTMEEALANVGICFLFAQRYHQSMRHVGPIRRELGFRTVFNLLGPLSNPARASHQLIGVFSAEHVEVLAQVLSRLGVRRAIVVHGEDGLDEITTCAKTRIAEVTPTGVITGRVGPEDFGIPMTTNDTLIGGDAKRNAEMILDVLKGNESPAADIVVLNAGAAIYVAEKAEGIAEGVKIARESVRSGAALDKLEKLREVTSRQRV